MSTMFQKEREKLYDNYPITNRAHSPDGFVDFCKHFKYLGSYISFGLTNNFDVHHQLKTTNQAMGALKYFWKTHMPIPKPTI